MRKRVEVETRGHGAQGLYKPGPRATLVAASLGGIGDRGGGRGGGSVREIRGWGMGFDMRPKTYQFEATDSKVGGVVKVTELLVRA